MDTVLRREIKYVLKGEEREKYINLFDKMLTRDPFSMKGAYNVRSLYFDSVNDYDFFEKINEQELRKKIRIRIYSPYDKFAKLELKQKQDVYQKKGSLKISKEDAQSLIRGEYHILLKYKEDFAKEMYIRMSEGCYKPKTIIEYQRLAFMAKENHIRITFDSEISSTESNYDIFSDKLSMLPALDSEYTILEVKYDKFMLEYIDYILGSVDKRPITASKYCMGRGITLPLYL